MGWKLAGIKTKFSDFSEGSLWGTNVIATFRLTYSKSSGKFQETPRLDWHETIMMNDHGKGETWVFDTNMYAHSPISRTMIIWPQRYIVAYDLATGGGYHGKGYAKVLSKSGGKITVKELGKTSDDAEKADAVRTYLQKNSGILEIQIHDVPSVNKPGDDEHKERLLLFNLGVVGGGSKVKAYQYLDLDGAKPSNQWIRQAGAGWGVSGMKTTGLNKVGPPGNVTAGTGPSFGPGECW